MKILIIGSKGFIGSHLTHFLSARGYEVWECDVLSEYENQRYFAINSSNSDFSDLFNKEKFEVCVNCSGAASVPDSIKHPYRDFALNTSNVFSVLNAIHSYNSDCHFINLSSAAVYGNPNSIPIKENANIAPISPYGRHKAMAEQIVREFAEEFGIGACSLRIFSVFGNGLRKQIFWDTFKKLSSSDQATFYGTGEETRDFIHVDDLCRVVEMVIKKASFAGEVINVANGIQTTIEYAVNVMAKFMNFPGEIAFSGKERKGDPCKWQADISILKSWGYEPEVSIEKGLSEYVKWAKENE